ncbi:MAG: hypothetical protein Q7K42_03630 [Candidatus Diapherotrites archaeon]|nr:hypothetical protein [Candidatus Diapherotrites archaeon]
MFKRALGRIKNWFSSGKPATKKRLPKEEPKEKFYKTPGSNEFQTVLVTRPGMRVLNQNPRLKTILRGIFKDFDNKKEINYFEFGDVSVQPIHSRKDSWKGNRDRKKFEITIAGKKLFCKLEKSYRVQESLAAEKVAKFLKTKPEWNGIKIEVAEQYAAINRQITTMFLTKFYNKEFVQGRNLGEEDKTKCNLAISQINEKLTAEFGRKMWDMDERNYFYNPRENKIILFDISLG